MTEQTDDLLDAFAEALADSADSATGNDTQITADAITDQTGNNEQAATNAAPGDQQHEGQHAEQAQPQDDPWASAPEPLRNQYQQLQQQFNALQTDHRANAGRVAALNRKTEELQQQLAAREAAGIASQKGAPTADDLEGKTFEEFEQEFPEFAKFVKAQVLKEVKPIQQQLEPVKEIVSERDQQKAAEQQQSALQDEFSQVMAVHPDAGLIAKDPTFHQWVSHQPAHIRTLYESTIARDNAVLLDLFKATPVYQQKQSGNQQQNNLADHVTTPKKGSGAPTANRIPEDGDFMSLFDHHLNQSRR